MHSQLSTVSERDKSNERDQALVRRIRAGGSNGASALDELLRAYGAGLLNSATSIIGDRDLAKDVVQEVFTRLWDTRDKLDIQGNVAAYLYRITRNCAINLLAHERAHQSLEARIAEAYEHKEPRVANNGEIAV